MISNGSMIYSQGRAVLFLVSGFLRPDTIWFHNLLGVQDSETRNQKPETYATSQAAFVVNPPIR
jgi:hypothetical protein